jgi:hypothetical protein
MAVPSHRTSGAGDQSAVRRKIQQNAARTGKTTAPLAPTLSHHDAEDWAFVRIAKPLLWLFVIDLGISVGAGLYEHRIVVPEWIGPGADGLPRWDAAAARAADTGRRFWVYVTTVPLTLLTLANLIAAWRSTGPQRGAWLIASLAALADRVMTFAYFIPTMVALMAATDSAESVATATEWSQLNYLRHVLGFSAWLAALRALIRADQPATSLGWAK